mgnify:CR=1 FL=1|jgi:hypothetical protein
MAKYKILYWHDIPSLVQANDENGRIKVQLHERFQESIDSAAMALGLIGSDQYTDGFQWGEENEKPGAAQEVAQSIAADLELKYQSIDWRALAKKLERK